MDAQRIDYLLGEFQTGSLPAGELEELRQLLLTDEYRQRFTDTISAAMQVQAGKVDPAFNEAEAGELFERIISIDKLSVKQSVSGFPMHRVHFLRTAWFRYAAVLLLLLGTGAYFWFLHYNRQQTLISDGKQLPMEILPGKDGAILTLADGSQVVLDSLGNGLIAMQNGSRAVLNNGQLAYDPTGKATGEMLYNTITTPKGRQFNVVLPDGTRVWLNAASSLRYPTTFSGKERPVMVTGEAYFEVAKDKAKPFLVKINNAATVKVLGTSFNVNAYEDEASIHTTLLEGSVRVMVTMLTDGQSPAAQPAVLLKPGQQAQTVPVSRRSADTNGGLGKTGIKLVENADIDKVMAWKNGLFNFQDKSLEEVMRQLERWYDIEVVYEKGIPDIHFMGEMSRGVSLAGLLKGLEDSKVHFRIEEGRRLVVIP